MRNEELIVSHKNYAAAIAISRRFRVRHYEVDDMVSESLLALVIAGRRFDGSGTFRGWVRQRIAGALDDWAVSKKQRYGISARGIVLPQSRLLVRLTTRNGGASMPQFERMPLLDAALRAIPTRLVGVLRMRFIEDDSCEDIAAALGVSSGRVSQLTKRGVTLLRKELALRGVRKVADLV